jgi:transcriptional regulator with XRE-family HTH domain
MELNLKGERIMKELADVNMADVKNDVNKNFYTQIQAKLTEMGKDNKDLARSTGLTKETIRHYSTESKGSMPTLDSAIAIAHSLGVSLNWLCGLDEPTVDEQSIEQLFKTLILQTMDIEKNKSVRIATNVKYLAQKDIDYMIQDGYSYEELFHLASSCDIAFLLSDNAQFSKLL